MSCPLKMHESYIKTSPKLKKLEIKIIFSFTKYRYSSKSFICLHLVKIVYMCFAFGLFLKKGVKSLYCIKLATVCLKIAENR